MNFQDVTPAFLRLRYSPGCHPATAVPDGRPPCDAGIPSPAREPACYTQTTGHPEGADVVYDGGPRLEVTVGHSGADFTGADHLALQGAVDYVAKMGGGAVHILPGIYEMGNSLFIREKVDIIGSGDETILRKCRSARTRLALDIDWYSNRVSVKDPSIFSVGGGLLLRGRSPHFDRQQFVKRTVIAIQGSDVYINEEPRENFWLETKPEACTLFPVITGNYVNEVTIESLCIDGNRAENENLDGNYGGCIFIQDCNHITVRGVTCRDYDGDGVSWQVCHDVTIEHCRSLNNAGLGLHPGSGSQRPIIRNNHIVGASQGLFFCWGVKDGIAEGNVIEDCGKYGISIGHHDTDNLIRNNVIRRSHEVGIYFREHPAPTRDPHRNVFEENLIVDSGRAAKGDAVAIDMNGTAEDVILRRNQVVDTRRKAKDRRRIGLRIGERVKRLCVEGMTYRGMEQEVVDLRK